MYNIISKAKYAYIFSALLTVLCFASIATWGLKFGIDFTGGTLMEIKFKESVPSVQEIETILKDTGARSLTMQESDNNAAILRYASEDDGVNDEVWKKIQGQYPESAQLRVDFINSSVSSQLKKNSLWAIFWAVAAIMGYIAWAFRKVSRPVQSWKYGAGAVIALVHDILITVGVFFFSRKVLWG